MSTNLYWEPNYQERNRSVRAADDRLKLLLREEYGFPLDKTFTRDDLPMFHGLHMSGVQGAQHVESLIEQHDQVRLYEAE